MVRSISSVVRPDAEGDAAFSLRSSGGSVTDQPLALLLASRIRESRALITGRWLERIAARVAVPAERIFPTDDLLDHMPLLIEGIAASIEDPGDPIAADSTVVHHARELGALRHAQGFNEHEILKEFEILGGVLFAFTAEIAPSIATANDPVELIACTARLFRALSTLQQATTARFLELAKTRVAERESRLRAFHRALTHEMRDRIGATLGAGQLLQLLNPEGEERSRLTGVVVRNADSMRLVLENLLELTRLDGDTREQRHVRLSSALAETTRQLRDMAEHHGVEVRTSAPIPEVEVSAAAIELCLANLISNGIKYAHPERPNRWIAISSEVAYDSAGEPSEVVVVVEDNGLGIPASAREQLFQRFFRAHADTHPTVEGTGLGLSLVREVLTSIGGRVWIDDAATGTRIVFATPCRRASDVATIAASFNQDSANQDSAR